MLANEATNKRRKPTQHTSPETSAPCVLQCSHLAPSRCSPTEPFSTKSRMIVAGSWPNDPFDTNNSDGSPHGRAFITAERDGYFRLRLANRKLHSPETRMP